MFPDHDSTDVDYTSVLRGEWSYLTDGNEAMRWPRCLLSAYTLVDSLSTRRTWLSVLLSLEFSSAFAIYEAEPSRAGFRGDVSPILLFPGLVVLLDDVTSMFLRLFCLTCHHRMRVSECTSVVTSDGGFPWPPI